MRLDVVRPDDSLRIKELKVIKPDFDTMDEIFTSEQRAYHCDSMVEAFKARPEKVSGLPFKYAKRAFL